MDQSLHEQGRPEQLKHMKATLGIDIAKRKHQVALDYQGKSRYKQIANTQTGFIALLGWLEKQQRKLGFHTVHICMEATGTYYEALAAYLVEAGYLVSVVNPSRIASFAQSKLSRSKTDSADAALIAQFCQEQTPKPWQPLPAEIKRLQALTRHLQVLKQSRQEHQNRLDTAKDSNVRSSFEALIAAIDVQIKQTQDKIKEHVDNNPDLKHRKDLLCTIPGIAMATALHLLAEIPPHIWAANARKMAAFAGLTPKRFTSGDSVKKVTRLCKTGSARLRRGLYMPALSARRFNPVLKHFGDSLAEQGKADMLIIGAIMRKLLHLAFGVIKHDQPFDPMWHKKQCCTA